MHCHTDSVAARVYELAREIGWTTRELKQWLQQSGEFVRSGASRLEEPVARRVRALCDDDRPVTTPPATGLDVPRAQPTSRPVYWAYQGEWDEAGTWVGPDPMTAKEATILLRGVKESTIRQWVHRGLLPVAGRLGRANLFSASDLRAARDAARQRNTSSTPTTRPQRELSRASFDTLVTITQAAQWTGINRSTLSSWVRRGKLRPVEVRGRTQLYRLRDVYRIARRTNPPGLWATPSYWDEEYE